MSAAAVNAYANRLAWEEAGTVWNSASHCSTAGALPCVTPTALRPYGLGKAVLLLALAPEVEGWRPRTANMSIKRYQTYPEYLEELPGTWEHFPCASLATCGGSSAPGLSWVLLPVVGCGQTKAPCNWTLCDMVLAWCMCQTCASKDKQQTESAKTGSLHFLAGCALGVVTTELSQLTPPPCDLTTTAWEAQKILPKVVQHLVLKCFGSVWPTANRSDT